MKKLLAVFVAAVVLVAIGVWAAVSGGDSRNVVEVRRHGAGCRAVHRCDQSIRGINGGGVPWVIGSAHGRLRADGRLTVEVEGLVVASSGANPAATFKAIVSCLSTDEPRRRR